VRGVPEPPQRDRGGFAETRGLLQMRPPALAISDALDASDGDGDSPSVFTAFYRYLSVESRIA